MTVAELERLAREQRATLLAFARSRARSREDAEDAVQQALTVALRVRERIDATTAIAYIGVIARHEATRLREAAERHRSLDQPLTANGQGCLGDALADSRQVDGAELLDLLGALRDAKPDHARALMARGLGWRYREIAELSGDAIVVDDWLLAGVVEDMSSVGSPVPLTGNDGQLNPGVEWQRD